MVPLLPRSAQRRWHGIYWSDVTITMDNFIIFDKGLSMWGRAGVATCLLELGGLLLKLGVPLE
jgi:hypothetical protein